MNEKPELTVFTRTSGTSQVRGSFISLHPWKAIKSKLEFTIATQLCNNNRLLALYGTEVFCWGGHLLGRKDLLICKHLVASIPALEA